MKTEGPQDIPSKWYQYAKDVGALVRANGQLHGKYPKTITQAWTLDQSHTWSVFLSSCLCWGIQPLEGGVAPPEIGPRNRSWWYARGHDFPIGYYNYFMKHTLNLYYAGQVPTWCMPRYLSIADFSNSAIKFYNPDTLTYLEMVGYLGTGNKNFNRPRGITSDNEYFYVADKWNNRIVKWSLLGRRYVAKVGTLGSGDNQFHLPSDITCDDTYLYITDTHNHRLIKLKKSDLSFVAKYEWPGDEEWQLNLPSGIICDEEYLFVCNTGNHTITKHRKSDLEWISWVGTEGGGDNQFKHPTGITSDGVYLYICDMSNHRIKKHLKWSMAYVGKIGSLGNGNDQFNFPMDITCDTTHLFLTDTSNHRLKKHLKSDLSFVAKVGSYGSGFLFFNEPMGVHVYNQPISPSWGGTWITLTAPDTNYAHQEWLRMLVSNVSGALRISRIYLKINIEGPYTLYLYANHIWDTTDEDRRFSIREMDPAAFEINTLTWNNRPGLGRLIGTFYLPPTADEWISFFIYHAKALCIKYYDESLPPYNKKAESQFSSSRVGIFARRPYIAV